MGNSLNNAIKFSTIEDAASTDQTSVEVKSLYESNSNTNVYNDSEKSILDSIPHTTYIAPTMGNGWVNYSVDEATGYAHAGYMKDENGNVFIKGLIKSGTISTTLPIFTLPVGYRPSRKIIRAVVCPTASGMGRLDIAADGGVIPNAGANGYFSIEVNFKAEQ